MASFDTQPTPGGGVPGDSPGKPKPSRPYIGDLPGEGSEGPTDLPHRDDACPHCEGTGKSDRHGRIEKFDQRFPNYRGEQQGRGGHFDAGHQKRTSPIDEDSTAEERYQREKKMGPLPYSKDDPESRAGGYAGPYPAGWNN